MTMPAAVRQRNLDRSCRFATALQVSAAGELLRFSFAMFRHQLVKQNNVLCLQYIERYEDAKVQ